VYLRVFAYISVYIRVFLYMSVYLRVFTCLATCLLMVHCVHCFTDDSMDHGVARMYRSMLILSLRKLDNTTQNYMEFSERVKKAAMDMYEYTYEEGLVRVIVFPPLCMSHHTHGHMKCRVAKWNLV